MNFPLTRDEDVTRRGMIIKSPSQSWQPEGPSSTKTKDVMLGVCACDCLKDHRHHWWTATALTGLRSAPWHFRAGFSSKQSKLPLLQGVSRLVFPGEAVPSGWGQHVVWWLSPPAGPLGLATPMDKAAPSCWFGCSSCFCGNSIWISTNKVARAFSSSLILMPCLVF